MNANEKVNELLATIKELEAAMWAADTAAERAAYSREITALHLQMCQYIDDEVEELDDIEDAMYIMSLK